LVLTNRAGIAVNRAIVLHEINQAGVSSSTISTLEARDADGSRKTAQALLCTFHQFRKHGDCRLRALIINQMFANRFVVSLPAIL
jgi:hypothetical protein